MSGQVLDPGAFIEHTHVSSSDECGTKCHLTESCGSVTFCSYNAATVGINCYLRGAKLTGTEPIDYQGPNCFSYYEKCSIGNHLHNLIKCFLCSSRFPNYI